MTWTLRPGRASRACSRARAARPPSRSSEISRLPPGKPLPATASNSRWRCHLQHPPAAIIRASVQQRSRLGIHDRKSLRAASGHDVQLRVRRRTGWPVVDDRGGHQGRHRSPDCRFSHVRHEDHRHLGPASREAAVVEFIAGVDVFRLNFSHGTHAEHRAVRTVRHAAAALGRHIAVLQDLSGPKIRTGRLPDGQPIRLVPGQRFDLVIGDGVGADDHVYTSYAPLATAVSAGDRLLLDDGCLQLRVESVAGGRITTTVVDGGMLGQHKGINAPGVPLPPAGVSTRTGATLPSASPSALTPSPSAACSRPPTSPPLAPSPPARGARTCRSSPSSSVRRPSSASTRFWTPATA